MGVLEGLLVLPMMGLALLREGGGPVLLGLGFGAVGAVLFGAHWVTADNREDLTLHGLIGLVFLIVCAFCLVWFIGLPLAIIAIGIVLPCLVIWAIVQLFMAAGRRLRAARTA